MTWKAIGVAAPHPNPLPASGERERANALAPLAGRERYPSRQRRGGKGQRLFLAFGIGLFIAGCDALPSPKSPPEAAASASAWSKPGADAAAVESAYRDCLEAADTVTDKDFNIDQDIAASRGGDLQRSSFAGRSLRDTQQNNRDRTQAILSSCMRGKGFVTAR